MRIAGKRPQTLDWGSLTQIVDSLPHATALLRVSGDIVHENLAFRSLRLQSDPQLSQTRFFDHLDPSDRAAITDLIAPVAANHEAACRFDWHPPGSPTVPYAGTITRLTFNDDDVGFMCQLQDAHAVHDPRLRYLMENLVEGVWDYDLKTGAFIASKAWHALRGLPADHEIDVSTDAWLDRVHPEDREALRSALHDQKHGDAKSMVIQYRHLHTNGNWVSILCRASVVESDPEGRPLRIIGTDTDISKAMESQESITRLAGKLKLAVEASGMGIWEFNAEDGKVHWDDRMLEIYGVTDGQNLRPGSFWEDSLHPDDAEETVAYAEEVGRKNADFNRDYRIVQPSGRIRHVRSLARVVAGPNGDRKLIGVNLDVTEDYQRAAELEKARAKLEHDALHDALTGLGNRRALDQRAAALFARITPDQSYAVMQVDLDHFKDVNDTLGHSAGDYVLSEVALILDAAIGALGRPFRVGGDEFSILFDVAPDKAALDALSEDLIERISQPMTFEGSACSVGASIGYAVGQGSPASFSDIFIEADSALYAAKRAGRFTYRAYTDEIGKAFYVISNVRNDLRDALNAHQIVCHLQPQYDVETLAMVGAEALLRWDCPKRGLLPPAEILPAAAEAGLMGAIDRYMFARVADLQTAWTAKGLVYPRVSINVSRARFEDETFLAQTQTVVGDHHRLALELLETTPYDTPTTAILYKLDGLRELGLRIEQDDFGTGYASVKALQALRPDAVKIDRSLVALLGAEPKQLDILQNLSRIARLEGAEVVVEGLETGVQIAAIRKLECDVLQGHLLNPPMSEADFAALLAAQDSYVSGAKKVG